MNNLRFLSNETFWVAVGSIATSVALIYTITKSWRDKKQEIENIKEGLKREFWTNVEILFTGEVERPPLTDVITKLRINYVGSIKDHDSFIRIQKLYNDLAYYTLFVEKVYLKPYIQNSGVYTTEKQLQICNSFIEYFGSDPIEYDLAEREEWNKKHPGQEYIDSRRNKAIEVKRRKQKHWLKQLENEIDKMFS